MVREWYGGMAVDDGAGWHIGEWLGAAAGDGSSVTIAGIAYARSRALSRSPGFGLFVSAFLSEKAPQDGEASVDVLLIVVDVRADPQPAEA
jgi:hypothetical protein